jgi:hypothetical protein
MCLVRRDRGGADAIARAAEPTALSTKVEGVKSLWSPHRGPHLLHPRQDRGHQRIRDPEQE